MTTSRGQAAAAHEEAREIIPYEEARGIVQAGRWHVSGATYAGSDPDFPVRVLHIVSPGGVRYRFDEPARVFRRMEGKE